MIIWSILEVIFVVAFLPISYSYLFPITLSFTGTGL